MKLKTLILAVAVLAALSLAVHLSNRPAPAPKDDPRVGKPVLDADTLQKAATLVVSDQGKTVSLARTPSGSWTVPAYYDFPADFEKIARFAQDLNEAKIDRFVTRSPERLAKMEFKDSFVALKDAGGKEVWRLTLGRNAESGSGRFVRFGDEPQAFFATLHVWLDTDPKSWADAKVVSLAADDISRIELTVEDKKIVVSRAKKDAPWTASGLPEGQKLIDSKVASLVTSLSTLRFTDTTDPKDPAVAQASAHARVVSLSTFGGKTYSFTFARKPEEKKLKAPVADTSILSKPVTKPEDAKPADTKPVTPEFETIPAGPVYVSVTSSEPTDTVNALMKKRAFQIEEYAYTGLPQTLADLAEPVKTDKAK